MLQEGGYAMKAAERLDNQHYSFYREYAAMFQKPTSKAKR